MKTPSQYKSAEDYEGTQLLAPDSLKDLLPSTVVLTLVVRGESLVGFKRMNVRACGPSVTRPSGKPRARFVRHLLTLPRQCLYAKHLLVGQACMHGGPESTYERPDVSLSFGNWAPARIVSITKDDRFLGHRRETGHPPRVAIVEPLPDVLGPMVCDSMTDPRRQNHLLALS